MSDVDTSDLRSGAPIHDALLALLPLVGVWRGDGSGIAPSGEQFSFGQQASFAHDGRPFLAYESRAWLVDDAGEVIRQAWRESGFWRLGAGQDDIEVVLASNTGEALVYAGVVGDHRWEIATASAQGTPTAKVVDAERRLYALVDDVLVYASDLAPHERPLAPHLNARLSRIRTG
ncbi:MAG: FABP family protein [Jatrophihabitantaceae bacterium]